ncbi:MAG TPA: hypothetical protein VHQ65_06560 [Thermoanaerobaculia bacterium]|nr:hypothetical protein [Thermoanaerobaculia bacterium]
MARAGRTRGIAAAALVAASMTAASMDAAPTDAAPWAVRPGAGPTTADAGQDQGDHAPGARDARADALAQRVLEAMGGRQGWEQVRWLRFGFAGRRTHLWDLSTGRHRVEGTTPEGEPYVVIHDLDTRQGRAWSGGEPATGEALSELLEGAWGAWVNDTYWLLMPWKLRDPGVLLTHEGTRELDGRPHEVLHLRFESVGLTPGDRYWVFVDPQTDLVAAWEYILEGQPAQGPATRWRWEGWQQHGPVLLAPRRVQEGSDRVLELAPLEVGTGEPPTEPFAGP